MWVDVSSLAVKVAFYTDCAIIEDSCCLRPIVAELDAVLRGVNLALKWWAMV